MGVFVGKRASMHQLNLIKMEKKNIRMRLFITAIIAGFIACKKENNNQDNLSYIHQSNTRLHDELSNSIDTEDEKINDDLFMLANAFSSFANDQQLMDIVYTKASAAGCEGDVLYSSLIATDSRFKTYLNDYLYSNYFSEQQTGYDCYNAIEGDMIYKQRQYTPGITVINISTCDKSLLPIICIGSEINKDDAIIAYTINSNGSKSETTINESTALASSRPVIIINNAPTVTETATATLATDVNTIYPAPQADTTYIFITFGSVQIKAGYAYESPNSDSDLRDLVSLTEVNSTWCTTAPYGSSKIGKRSIMAVTRTQVDSSAIINGTHPAVIDPIDTYQQNWDRMYVTLYEHDWYAIKKPISVCYTNLVHAPRMKYQNEWYINNICNYQYLFWFPHPTPNQWAVNWQTYKFSATVGRQTL